jgi:hypothetical protein
VGGEWGFQAVEDGLEAGLEAAFGSAFGAEHFCGGHVRLLCVRAEPGGQVMQLAARGLAHMLNVRQDRQERLAAAGLVQYRPQMVFPPPQQSGDLRVARVQAPCPIWLVAIAKVLSGAAQGVLSAIIVLRNFRRRVLS